MPDSARSEIVEVDLSSIQNSSLINDDIAPTKISQRKWGTYDIADRRNFDLRLFCRSAYPASAHRPL